MSKKVLFILAHPYPNRSVANRFIADQIKNIPNVTFHDLYETYPYFNIDIKKEQDLLVKHDLIVFQHPFYWYNMPPLLKLWEDEVLEDGFSHGNSGNALRGKNFLLSITTGGSSDAYSPNGANRFLVHSFLHSYEQLCYLCGLNWNPPHILHSSRKTDQQDILAHANRLKECIVSFIEKGSV
jgi:glutathione-regulated potassium-efflux system ancillary protein KefG